MLRVTLVLALALPACSQGFGEGRGIGPERLLGGTVEELTAKLSLAEEQVPKLQEVFDETEVIMMEAFQVLRDQGRHGGWGQICQAYEAIREDQSHAVRAVLDEKQRLAYNQLLAEVDVRGADFGGGFGGRSSQFRAE